MKRHTLVFALLFSCTSKPSGAEIPDFEEACKESLSCECLYHNNQYDSVEECVILSRTEYASYVAIAKEANLILNTDCLLAEIPHFNSFGCQTWSQIEKENPSHVPTYYCHNTCQYAFGDVPEYGSCIQFNYQVSNCEKGLICSHGICLNPCLKSNENEPCSDYKDCNEELYCAEDLHSGELKCFPNKKIGEECTILSPEKCTSEAFCYDGFCLARAKFGEFCDIASPAVNYLPCIDNLFCNPKTSTCSEPLQLGDPCINSFDCPWNATCTNETCVPLQSEGESCTEDWECTVETWCNNGKCDNPKSNGSSCISDIECEFICREGFCAPEEPLVCMN